MYKYKRIIPILSIIGEDLFNTYQFKRNRYLGDPINAVKIFNEKLVDELAIVDIRASVCKSSIQFGLLEKIANQAFMPLSYGGGINSLDDVIKIFRIGFEKVIVNSLFFENRKSLADIIKYAGSQSIILSLDLKKKSNKSYFLYSKSGQKKEAKLSDEVLDEINNFDFGEVIINNITLDGVMGGYDEELILSINNKLKMPVIPYGGASSYYDIKKIFRNDNISAAAATSIFVYSGSKKAVLLNYPERNEEIT